MLAVYSAQSSMYVGMTHYQVKNISGMANYRGTTSCSNIAKAEQAAKLVMGE